MFVCIDIAVGDEEQLLNIGFDDVIQRLILNILTHKDYSDASHMLASRSDNAVDILCDTILQFPGKVMTITEMQELTGLSDRSLRNAFNKRFGCTPREWQRIEHLKKARELLTSKNNNQTVKEISYSLGFLSPQSFSRHYLEHFGELPSNTITKKN